MPSVVSVRVGRAAFLVGLLAAIVGVVEARAATAPTARPVEPATATDQSPGSSATPSAPSTGSVAAGTVPPPSTVATTAGRGITASRSLLGPPVVTPYGTVQVRLILRGPRITDVIAVQLPSDGRSAEIASYAAPLLRSEVLNEQSARIDTVSGASYTSDGYARSVQAALDQAALDTRNR